MDPKDSGVYDFLGYKGRFPQNRVEKLMNLDRNCGLTSRVLVEGAFIELTPKGHPARQVYLGLTSDELIFVTQDISPNSCTKNKPDLELEGLVIDAIYPLSNITVVPSNDRLMAFSVVIPGNTVLHFEMCKLDASFRNKWNIWRTLLDEISDRQCMNNSKNSNSTKGDGTQTNVIQSESPSTSTGSESDMGVWSVNSDDLMHGTSKYGSNPTERLKFMFGGHPIMYRPVFEREDDMCCISKSASWSDITTYVRNSSPKVDVMSFQKILKNRERSSSHILQTITPINIDKESDSDSEEDIDAIFDEAITIQQRSRHVRPAAQLWCLAKELTIGNVRGSFNRMLLEKAVDHVIFQAITTRKKPIAESLLDCQPLEVALELTIMSRGLLMAIRPSDLQQCRKKWSENVPVSVQNIRRHGELLCKLVMSEVLRSHVLGDRVTMLKFFIDVCFHLLFTEKDFNTLVYILRGMTSLPVYRLENTWATFFVQEPLKFSVFKALVSLLSPVGHYKSYRTRINVCTMRKSPYVPWFDHFLAYCRDIDLNTCEARDPIDKCLIEHKEAKQTNDENNIEIPDQEKRHKRMNPEAVCGNSADDVKMISILKRKKCKRIQRKLKKLLNIFKRKEKKTVTFMLSEMDLFREAEHEMNDSNMKHLAKTRKYPVDYELRFGHLSGALGQFNEEARYQYREFIRDQGNLSAVKRFSEGLSVEIINDAFKSMYSNIRAYDDVKHNAGEDDTGNQKYSDVGCSKGETKKIDKFRSNRKTPIGWLQNKISHRKDRKKNKADIEHVNIIQTDIDEINNLLEGLPGQNSDNHLPEDGELNRNSKKKTRIGDTCVTFKETGRDIDSTLNPGTEKKLDKRRQSYIPASVLRDRRKSLFEEAFDDEKDEQADDEFARSMDKKMIDLKGRRKSVALELLESDGNSTFFSGGYENHSNNYNDLQKQVNLAANDQKQEYSSCQPDNNRKSSDFTNELKTSISAENIGISRSEFKGRHQHIYSESVYDQLFLFQKLALDTHEHSCKRVRECLEKLMREADDVSNFDLFNLSLIRE